MNSQFQYKLLQTLNKKNRDKGFTLIELLVVVIIIGVLAAIALPNLLGQVAKGRQAEARNNLGTISRAQQAYRLESGSFGNFSTTTANNQLPVSVTGQYYAYPDTNTVGTVTPQAAVTNATSIATYTNDIRDYSSAVGQSSAGAFSTVICETNDPTTAVVNATVTNGVVQACAANSKAVN
ncbi:type IV pilin-like G/H family protein [Pannus brasiliensis CCIBt3594]|uniref:Type IV pilin-like G/H family protein n=1 Tax=Pannus brasiliensis CCIBt3594 TaxID=1427578 RepID=A0AAW9QHP0_9CHRO